MQWLFKEEPTLYSFDDLQKDKKTKWSGVHNNLALKYLKQVKKGDEIFFYHTGKERRIIGTMKALGDAYVDGSSEVAVDVAPLQKLGRPITLDEIKSNAAFKDFLLVKISRLSVMPVNEDQWKKIRSL